MVSFVYFPYQVPYFFTPTYRISEEETRHFGNKKGEYPKDKMSELATDSKNKNTRAFYRGSTAPLGPGLCFSVL
jgi:hypothetical protein